jgi:two-component system response regulator
VNPGYILLVEDNPNDEALTIRALRKSGVANDIVVARDGVEAIEHIFAVSGTETTHLGLVLLDLKIPKIDGLEVLRRIRANERTAVTPVVILTSSNEDQDVFAGYLGGANAYVRKPVDFVDFASSVATLGLFWLLISEPPPCVTPIHERLARHESQ